MMIFCFVRWKRISNDIFILKEEIIYTMDTTASTYIEWVGVNTDVDTMHWEMLTWRPSLKWELMKYCKVQQNL